MGGQACLRVDENLRQGRYALLEGSGLNCKDDGPGTPSLILRAQILQGR